MKEEGGIVVFVDPHDICRLFFNMNEWMPAPNLQEGIQWDI